MVNTYDTELLNPSWWVNSLLGSSTMLLLLVEIWLLSFVRRIPNVKSFVIILMGINITFIGYAIFAADGFRMSISLLGLILLTIGIIAWSLFSDS